MCSKFEKNILNIVPVMVRAVLKKRVSKKRVQSFELSCLDGR